VNKVSLYFSKKEKKGKKDGYTLHHLIFRHVLACDERISQIKETKAWWMLPACFPTIISVAKQNQKEKL
jgi:hypothetical protein